MSRALLSDSEIGLEQQFVEGHFLNQGRYKESSSIYPMGFKPPSELHIAAAAGFTSHAIVLIENGADLNARALGAGYTPLMYAAQNGHGDMVELLLDRGADIHIKTNRFHKSALSEAAQYNHPMIAAFLLSRGANPADLDALKFSCHYKALISCLEFGIRLWEPALCRDYHEPTDPPHEPLPELPTEGEVLGDNTNPGHLE